MVANLEKTIRRPKIRNLNPKKNCEAQIVILQTKKHDTFIFLEKTQNIQLNSLPKRIAYLYLMEVYFADNTIRSTGSSRDFFQKCK